MQRKTWYSIFGVDAFHASIKILLLNERVAEDVTSNPHYFTLRPNRQKVRQRVRRPQVVPQQELVPVEEGPPKFALDNEEAIQACTRPYPLY